jgi:hypothetical protein
MLLRGTPVRLAGSFGEERRVAVLVRDVYRRDGTLYIRYSIDNRSGSLYGADNPEVLSLKSPRSSRSLHTLRNTQITERFTSAGVQRLEVIASELSKSLLAPGDEGVGVVAIRPPRDSAAPSVLRLSFPDDSAGQVDATLVL